MADKFLGDRQNVLKQVAADLMKRAKELPRAQEKELLVALIKNLQDFADGHLGYFKKRETDKKTPLAFTPEYTYRVLAGQFGNDLSLFEQVIAQRKSDALRLTLEVSDRLAQQMLEPAITAGFFKLEEPFDRPIAITYLQKAASIRVIPYAPIALIGIPYSCVITETDTAAKSPAYRAWAKRASKLSDQKDINTVIPLPEDVHNTPIMFDFLAVPHEIGHYVYRFGRIPESARNIAPDLPAGTPISDSAYLFRAIPGRAALSELDLPAWVQNWAEEIFADMYGCRVAGPYITLDFQELLLGNYTFEDFCLKDDGDHPLPALRPEIYALTLDDMLTGDDIPVKGKQWSDYFRNRWKNKEVVKQAYTQKFVTEPSLAVYLEDATPKLTRLVRHLKPILSEVQPAIESPTKLSEDSLLTEWAKQVKVNQSQAAALIHNWNSKDSSRSIPWKDYWENGNWEAWQDKLVQDSLKLFPLSAGETRDEREWRVTLNWMSWTTEGPDKDPPTGI